MQKENETKENETKEKKEKDHYSIGSKIFITCLIFLGIIYVVDTLLGLLGHENVGVTNEVLETVKTLLFTISGYLFGKNVNHYSEHENKDEMKTSQNKDK